jgi:hypothetical protein
MKKYFPFVWALFLVAGFFTPSAAQNQKPPEGEVWTAIDVAEWILSGSSEVDIAGRLSSRRGFDRAAALNKGKTDAQIIAYLIAGGGTSENPADRNQGVRHKANGDRYFQEGQPKKAAQEYSLAAAYSQGDYAPYKSRGDVYRQYLVANLAPSPGGAADEAQNALLDKTRKFLCRSVYVDYKKAAEMIDETIRKNIAAINAMKFRMEQKAPNYDKESQASPTRSRTAQEIRDMRQMKTLSQTQVMANQAQIKMKNAVADYKLACGKEDAARRESLRNEREAKREKQWVKFAETGEDSFFYDRPGVVKSGRVLEVWTRRENANDETAFQAVHLRLDCPQNAVGTLESSSYDEMGELVAALRHENVTMTGLFPGSWEAMLAKEVCR